MTSEDRRFWFRFVATAFAVNTPIAYALASGALSVVAAFSVSAVLGVALLVVWDGTRTRRPEPQMTMDPGTPQASVRQTDVAVTSRNHA